ncbi:MAG: AzlC family ABC transporter permease [Thermotogae bacterium]|nr:AzlC family ABC transporter permease [Thermotogota bacterium]
MLSEKKSEFLAGTISALPIVMGYLPIGIAYGILAIRSGLSIFQVASMSLMVFAGSSQFIAIDMIKANSDLFSIVLTTFLVNLRHLLLSASMALKLKESPDFLIPILSFLITDESFAISIVSIDKYRYKYYYFLGLGLTAYASWVLSSFLGAIIGFFIYKLDISALDFVLPAMFIVLLVLQIKRKMDVLIAIISGVLSIVFSYLTSGNWNIILATVLTATLGVILDDD